MSAISILGIVILLGVVAALIGRHNLLKTFQKSLDEGDVVKIKMYHKENKNRIEITGDVYKREGNEVIVAFYPSENPGCNYQEEYNEAGFESPRYFRVNVKYCYVW